MYEYHFYLEMLMKSLTSLLILFRLNYAHFISHMMDSIESFQYKYFIVCLLCLPEGENTIKLYKQNDFFLMKFT